MKSAFISDIHIKDINERSSIILLRFLSSMAQENFTHLFLLGDIFDLWVGPHDHFVRKYQPFVDAVHQVQKAGIQVVYMEGNHDVHIDHFWQKEMGVEVFVRPQYRQLGPFVVRIEHGDDINPNDVSYLKYREKIRSPFAQKLARLIPGRFLDVAGSYASKKSRKRSHKKRNDMEGELKNLLHDYSLEQFQIRQFDYLISGHIHIFIEDKLPVVGPIGKNAYSINLGSWFESPKVFVLTNEGGYWQKLTEE